MMYAASWTHRIIMLFYQIISVCLPVFFCSALLIAIRFNARYLCCLWMGVKRFGGSSYIYVHQTSSSKGTYVREHYIYSWMFRLPCTRYYYFFAACCRLVADTACFIFACRIAAGYAEAFLYEFDLFCPHLSAGRDVDYYCRFEFVLYQVRTQVCMYLWLSWGK